MRYSQSDILLKHFYPFLVTTDFHLEVITIIILPIERKFLIILR